MVVDERRSWKPKERLAVASLLRDQAHPVVTAVGHAAARGSAPGDVLETLAALGEAGPGAGLGRPAARAPASRRGDAAARLRGAAKYPQALSASRSSAHIAPPTLRARDCLTASKAKMK